MRKIVLLLLMSVTLLPAMAQKKELSEAKTYIKSGKNLDKAETLLRKVIAMPEQNEKLDNFVMLADVMRKQYESTNEKLYLHTLTDTASIFPLLRRMFLAYESLDSIDAKPDKKGRVELNYRRKNAEFLDRYRPNIYRGGIFALRKQKYEEVLLNMRSYLDCLNQPLFESLKYNTKDTLRHEAAYWALFSACKLKNYDAIEQYKDSALLYEPKTPFTLSMLYESYVEKGDTLAGIDCLRRGFEAYAEYPFFFPRLVDYYTAHNQIDTVQTIVDKALEKEPGNQFYRIAENLLLLNLGRYDECIALGDSLIRSNDKLTSVYLNVGSAYFNKALARDKEGRESRAKRKEVNEFYRKAEPYLEKYREMRPKSQEQWAPMLYTIYLNLNEGEKFDEIDKMIKSNE